jgi:hypothetical protein
VEECPGGGCGGGGGAEGPEEEGGRGGGGAEGVTRGVDRGHAQAAQRLDLAAGGAGRREEWWGAAWVGELGDSGGEFKNRNGERRCAGEWECEGDGAGCWILWALRACCS